MPDFVYVFVGCGLGGVCRYTLSAHTLKSVGARFPWGTLAANLLGCLLIGIFLGFFQRHPSQRLAILSVTGFCGGFTTFSTFASETLLFVRQGSMSLAVSYVALSLVAGLGCVALGFLMIKK